MDTKINETTTKNLNLTMRNACANTKLFTNKKVN